MLPNRATHHIFPLEKMVKEVSFGCQIISFGFTILLDYLLIFKVIGLMEVDEHIYIHYQVSLQKRVNAILIGSSNIRLCQYLHQVTACSLYLLRKEAHEQYFNNSNLIEANWVKVCEENNPTFKY